MRGRENFRPSVCMCGLRLFAWIGAECPRNELHIKQGGSPPPFLCKSAYKLCDWNLNSTEREVVYICTMHQTMYGKFARLFVLNMCE